MAAKTALDVHLRLISSAAEKMPAHITFKGRHYAVWPKKGTRWCF